MICVKIGIFKNKLDCFIKSSDGEVVSINLGIWITAMLIWENGD